MSAVANTQLSDKKVPASNGLIMSKSITKDVKNTTDTRYTIQLESYAAGKVTTSTKSTPCDIVLVLDESGSMKYSFERTYKYQTYEKDTTNKDLYDSYYYEDEEGFYYYYHDKTFVKTTSGDLIQVTVTNGWKSTGWFEGYNTYTYTYEYNGSTYTSQVFEDKEGAKTKIPSSANNVEFFADGIEKQLYYAIVDKKVSRREALQQAANNFLNSVAADAAKSNADHRIAVVGFADGAFKKVDLTNVKNTSGQNAVQNAINGLDADGATNTGAGMGNAVTIFKNQNTDYQNAYNSGKRKKVVVLFTDGVPTTSNYFHEQVANTAIGHAKTLKGDKTTVYTIGVFEGANATQQPTASGSETEKANTFMQYVSSNFPNAARMNSGGAGKINGGYYLTAKNTADLNKIFESISESIGESTIQLNGRTQTIDKMSADFKLPNGTSSSNIKVYKVPYKGKDSVGNDTFETDEAKWDQVTQGITVDTANDTVTVTGFDYTEDYVVVKDGKPQGYKLVVRIPAEYKNDAWFGGNDIESNDIGSGIYNGGSCYGTFEVPKVNRAIDYKIDAKDQTIYVTNQADLKELLAYPEKDAGRTYQPNGTNNKYVDITYTLKKGDAVIGTYKIERGQSTGNWTLENGQALDPALEDCTEYTWTCTVTPNKSDGKSLGVAGTGTTPAKETKFEGNEAKQGTVHVLYPTVEVKDEKIYWGETVTLANLVKEADTWKDRSSHTDIPNARAPKPTVTVTPTCVADDNTLMPAKDSAYTVTVKVGDKDVTAVVHGMDGIKNTAPVKHTGWNCDDHADVDNKTYDFCIHVKSKKLTVEKIVGGNMGDTNQEFEFRGTKVYGEGSSKPFTLKNGNKKDFKLKVGEVATVTETAADGYTTTIDDNNAGGTASASNLTYTYKVERESPDAVTVTYTNTKQITPPNGIITTIAPYAIMVVLAAGAGVYFVYSRRRRNR